MRIFFKSLVLLIIAHAANAATPMFDSQGFLIGATGVDVNGATYNFVLRETTCALEYNGCDELADFPFGNNPNPATLAIVDQVLPGLTSDRIFGCSRTEHPRLSFCDLVTPAPQSGVILGGPARVNYLGNTGFSGNYFLGGGFDFSTSATRVLVVWSPGTPDISVPAAIDFGNVPVGTQAEEPFVIANIGTADLIVNDITVEPEGTGLGWAPSPTIPESPGALPLVIAPGSQGTPGVGARIFFFALNTGPAAATLRILSNDPSTPVVEIELSGNGISESTVECAGLTVTIVGTAGSDVLLGTSGDDVIAGLDGDDLIRGRGGNDTICGGAGNDLIFGNQGDDNLYGEAGDDTVLGGAGFDLAVGDDGADVLQGNGDDDTVDGGDGPDRLLGGAGSDLVLGCFGNDTLIGNGGGDALDGGDGTDTCDNTGIDEVVDCEILRLP